MSIVGPRPLLVKYLPYYTTEERRRHAVRPGLTGLAQVNGRNALRWEDRFAYDVDYVDCASFIGDVTIIVKTVISVLRRTDVVAPGILEDFDDYRRKQLSGKYTDSDDMVFDRKSPVC